MITGGTVHQISGRWRLGLALALLTAACWGVLPIALKLLLEGMDAYTVTWYRFATSVAVLGVFLAATRNLPSVRTLGGMGWTFMLVALVGLVGNYVLYLLALRHVSPSVNQTVIQLAPIFLLFGGLFIYKERFTGWQRAGFVTLVSGLMLFFNRRLPELADVSAGLGLGVLLLLIAALVWAGYALAQKSLLKTLSSQQILWILYIGAVALLLPVSELGQIANLSPLQWALLAFSCANTLVAYGAFAEAMEHWEVSRVSAVLSISPLFTLVGMWLVSWLAPGYLQPEGLNLLSIGGALLVVAGSALTALGGQKMEKESVAVCGENVNA